MLTFLYRESVDMGSQANKWNSLFWENQHHLALESLFYAKRLKAHAVVNPVFTFIQLEIRQISLKRLKTLIKRSLALQDLKM